jgi:ribulose-phosphate 3-epimerase
LSKKYLIAPSILAADHSQLAQQVKEVEAAGGDWIHVDIMDGHFVPNMSMGPLALKASRKATSLPQVVHLMVEAPERFIEIYTKAGADHITFQIEATPNIHWAIQRIHELGCKAGVALNPGTPYVAAEPVLHLVDQVLVMSVNPGYGGQKFLPEVLPKIEKIRYLLDQLNPDAIIGVDGGIDPSTLPQALDAGAGYFVAGNFIFNHPEGIAAGIQALKVKLPH